MGPPDKFDEYFNHGDTTVRGSILRWVYYNYMLVIEFVDEKGNGQFKIRNYDGDFFGAIDILKLGTYVGTKDVFLKKIVNFNLTYDRKAGEIEVTLPAKLLNFKENDAGKFQIDLRFKFYIYEGPSLGKKTLKGAHVRVHDPGARRPEDHPLPVQRTPEARHEFRRRHHREAGDRQQDPQALRDQSLVLRTKKRTARRAVLVRSFGSRATT